MTTAPEPVETVAGMALGIAVAEHSREAAERWARRAELLAGWLFAAWRREQEQAGVMVVQEHNLN
ncbi:MAG: hypothetical protein HUU26_00530 [Gemmatimonadaceae bacterium]|nr:hypothetical protein [Phycisphaerae bacterium]NUQ10803.1 hypothetical protein [Gemmatimonadaceae bacterium]